MAERGTEKAARVADLMQTVARILVLVIIIPAAILLAVYFLLAGLIPDNFIRGMFSLNFGLGLAGMFVARMKRPRLGSFMAAMAGLSGAASLAVFWNSLLTSIVLVHIYFIILFGILKFLYRVHVIPPWRWNLIRAVSGFTIVLSAPFGLAILLDTLGFQFLINLAYSLFLLWIYSAGAQYYLKDTRMGIANTLIPAFATSLLIVQNHLVLFPASEIHLTSAVGLIGFGIGLLVVSQILRFVQRSLSFRPIRCEEEKLKKARLLREVGMDNYADNIEESVEPAPEWIIKIGTAQSLSGLSIITIALGFPIYFMWMAFSTPWGVEPAFNLLFTPIAVLLTLLILVPSPILFRSGGQLKRPRETFIMKGIGGIIVVDAVFLSIIWTQFLAWTITSTFSVAIILGITGATGVFERVRHLWKRFGVLILNSVRRLRNWISVHVVHTAVFVNIAFSTFILYIIYPIMNTMPYAMVSTISVGVFVFSLNALLGIATLSEITRRKLFAAIGWSTLLISLSSLSFWHLYSNIVMDPVLAVAYSLTWFLGFAALQKVDITRRYIGVPFGAAVLALLFIFLPIELSVAAGGFPFISLFLTVFLLGFIFHQEYLQFYRTTARLVSAAGRRIYSAASRAIQKIIGAVTRFLSAAKVLLVRVGGFVYRGIVFIGVQLTRFVAVLYAAVIVVGISNFGFPLLSVPGVFDPLFVIFGMALAFFILFSPSLLFRERHKSPLMQVCIIGIGVAFGGFMFSLTLAMNLGLRIAIALAGSLIVFTAERIYLPERIRLALPVATWLSILTAGTYFAFLSIVSISQIYALLICSIMVGFGILPLRLIESLRRAIGGFYLALATPAGTYLAYLFTYDLTITLSVIVLLPS
ncbi:MAG: hypothetical protein ACXAEF_09895, partial [Candidatus Thorarchaeota archaeon]